MTTSTSLTVGTFNFSTGVSRWTWSDGLFALHGMAPGEVVPTRALFLSHVHPEDRVRVEQELDLCALDGVPVATQYRLVDLGCATRTVLVAVAPGPEDESSRVWGVVVDDTERHRLAVAEGVNHELARALESHAVIDQAKGLLMAVYGVDGDAAFDVMRRASQRRNVRLRSVAEKLMSAVQAGGGFGPQVRRSVDDTFMAVLDDTVIPHQHGERPGLDLSFDRGAPELTLRVVGTVDLLSMGELVGALNRLLVAGQDGGRVVVDLSGVDRNGSVTRSVVTGARRHGEARGISMRIVVGAHDDDAWTVPEEERPEADGPTRASATSGRGW
ncbi:ANTAR domain-containing protein [uncultured Cellulomonas sp.]|uniref:ANTAR domain-containing protein n=1 Tax=uncultured Cellulomonas sp. TaxID=189682 RepID=UPI0028EC47BA|nr:ANTAR domain-containing protein [uncultured Cellulomonas sp.]